MKGQILIDGWSAHDFNIGDKLLLDASDDKVDLTSLSLQLWFDFSWIEL